MSLSVMLLLSFIGALGFLCQWLAWRIKLPAILFLLVSGILLGPISQILQPDKIFGELLFPFISLAVSIILFEGSLTLKRSELKDIGSTVRNMVTLGIIINGGITTLAAHYLAGFSWPLAALFGSIMVVTGPTVIIPMLRATRPNDRISRVLRWEGIIIDPIGALLAVIVFELIISSQHLPDAHTTNILVLFLGTIAAGLLTGVIAAFALGFLLRRNWLPDYLQNYAALAFVTVTFAASEAWMHESGLVAVTVMGIFLVNMKGVHIRSILHFKENLTTIFVSVLFIILAARMDFAQLVELGWGALGVFLVMQFIARPLKVFASAYKSGFSLKEKLLVSWIGPRGIVAAAVSAVFALRLEQAGLVEARLMVPLTFSVIIGTVLVQGLTARPLACWLKVVEPNNNGYLVTAANPVAICISQALKKCDIHTVLCDANWENISSARMAGLDTYYGNPVSHHADLYLNASGIGGVLGLSFDHEKNRSAALRYKEDYSVKKIFSLADKNRKQSDQQERYIGQTLFSDDTTYGTLASMISHGASVKKTTLTQEYNYENWLSQNTHLKPLMLFTIDAKAKLRWQVHNQEQSFEDGTTIAYLVIKPTEAEASV